MCAGLIGYRALKAAGPCERLGLYGFGAAAHIVAQIARHQGKRVFAFTRPGDTQAQAFARALACEWVGGSDEKPPAAPDAAIIFAPVGELVPAALRQIEKGGTLVLGGINMSAIPAMPYEILWGGRLEGIHGVGHRRALAIKGVLSERLGHRHFRPSSPTIAPAVSVLLDVDREYLEKVGQDSLRKIAPKRFNPTNEAWLPVLHTRRGDWLFTVLFSNTQRAHVLNKTRDWVVVYFHAEAEPEAQCTIVTETRGPLEGRCVVRGREGDCVASPARYSTG